MNLKTKLGFLCLKPPTLKTALLLIFIISITGCSSGFKTISPDLANHPQNIEKLGHVEGSACGSLIINVIPAKLNSRVERAYSDAISKKSEATALTKVTMDESWFWWLFGVTRCVTIEGEAIK